MADFVEVANSSDLLSGEMKLVEVHEELVLLANVEGKYYGVSETCTHAGCSLSEGWLEGHVLECPCHGAQFDVTTGEVLAAPAEEPLTRYSVMVEEDKVLVGPSYSV